MRAQTDFPRTLRALDADGPSPTFAATILILVLAIGGATWFTTVRVPVYEQSQAARIEVERVHPVAATVSGRVVSTTLVLGREVREGDVLIEIESGRESLDTAAERTRLATTGGELTALAQQIHSEQQALEVSSRAARAGSIEAAERVKAAESAASQARARLARAEQLQRQGLTSTADAETARGDDHARRADLAAARAAADRLEAEQSAAERDRRSRLAALLRERVALEGARGATASAVRQRERETDLRKIRAAVSGRLGEVTPVVVGAVIAEGQRVASIVPAGQMRVVAAFAPPALGRLRAGQNARVRLDGFPWTQYGYVNATVSSVATETREQNVRVELTIPPGVTSIPLQHGMPGTVEVLIDRATSLALLVRSLGSTLTVEGSSAVAPPPGTTPDRARE